MNYFAGVYFKGNTTLEREENLINGINEKPYTDFQKDLLSGLGQIYILLSNTRDEITSHDIHMKDKLFSIEKSIDQIQSSSYGTHTDSDFTSIQQSLDEIRTIIDYGLNE